MAHQELPLLIRECDISDINNGTTVTCSKCDVNDNRAATCKKCADSEKMAVTYDIRDMNDVIAVTCNECDVNNRRCFELATTLTHTGETQQSETAPLLCVALSGGLQ